MTRYMTEEQRLKALERAKQRGAEKRLMQFRLARLVEKKPELGVVVSEYWALYRQWRWLHNKLETELHKEGIIRNFDRVKGA